MRQAIRNARVFEWAIASGVLLASCFAARPTPAEEARTAAGPPQEVTDQAQPGREPYPLSETLQTLERDLTNREYQAVVEAMIPTDLAAEWQRIATVDNYLVFAEKQGGAAAVEKEPALRAAYAKRRDLANRFLTLLRDVYRAKKLSAPFDDAQTLDAVLRSAAERLGTEPDARPLEIRPVFPAARAEREWPRLRGPDGQGLVRDTDIPWQWSHSQNVLWKTRLPGRGNSSPIIWGDRLFVTAESEPRPGEAPLAPGDTAPDRILLCYQIDPGNRTAHHGESEPGRDNQTPAPPATDPRPPGSLLWSHTAPRPTEHETLYWKNTLASSTPVTDGEVVITFFGNAGLLACDLAGNRLWHVDLGKFLIMHGPGATPVLYQDLVIVMQDQNQGTPLAAAFDKRTGRRVWEQERASAMGWASPVVLRMGDRDELIFNGSSAVVSYDPLTGSELWRAAGTSIESIPMIVHGGGLLYSVSGRNGPIFAIRPGGVGDVTQSHVVWRHERGGSHVPTPTYHAGKLYVISDTGVLTCLEAATGKTLAQKRLRGRFSMSPQVVGDRLLFVNEEGLTYVVQADAGLEVLGQNDLAEPVLATPAILRGRIYFRTAEHLVAIGTERETRP